MIDVGAHWGSTLQPYASRGWSVHAFEPDPGNREHLQQLVMTLPTVDIVPLAVSTQDGETVVLYASDVSTGISTLTPFHPSHRPVAEVKTCRLDTYMREHAVSRVDLLKSDTEGRDFDVMRSFPWSEVKPQIVICEFEDRKTIPLGHESRELADFLVHHGYVVLVSEWFPIVEYGMSHRWRRVKRYPCHIPHDAWGNFVAVPADLASKARTALLIAGTRSRIRSRVQLWAEALVGQVLTE